MTPLLLQNLLHLGVATGGLLALLALLHVQERLAGRFLAHRLGWRAVLLTGWIGVPIHELSHLAAALVFGHRVIAWKLFDPDPVTGTLGYVRHAYQRRSPWQLLGTFAIGVAPAVAGAALLAALCWWIVPAAERGSLGARCLALGASADSGLVVLLIGLRELATALAAAVWEGRSWFLPLQLYLGVAVASHMAPSAADLSGALPGAVLGLALFGAAAIATSAAGVPLAGVIAALVPLLLVLLGAAAFQGLYVLVVGLACRAGRSPLRSRTSV